jgi:hypothetical protein
LFDTHGLIKIRFSDLFEQIIEIEPEFHSKTDQKASLTLRILDDFKANGTLWHDQNGLEMTKSKHGGENTQTAAIRDSTSFLEAVVCSKKAHFTSLKNDSTLTFSLE